MSEPFVPIAGQSFCSEEDWINRATRALTSHPEYLNTEHGERRGWRGHHFTALCFDQAGNRMRNGGDFMRATKEGTYPVWWIWPDQIVSALRTPRPPYRRSVVSDDTDYPWDTNHSGYRAIFNAALSGIVANPVFFGPIMQGSPAAAVEFADSVVLAATRRARSGEAS